MSEEELKDYVLGLIINNREITRDKIILEYGRDLDFYNIDIKSLDIILSELINNKIIYKTDLGYLKKSIFKENFSGFNYSKLKSKRRKKRKILYQRTIRTLPILLSVIFGFLTTVLSYKNYKISEERLHLLITNDSLSFKLKIYKELNKKYVNEIILKDSIINYSAQSTDTILNNTGYNNYNISKQNEKD